MRTGEKKNDKCIIKAFKRIWFWLFVNLAIQFLLKNYFFYLLPE